MKNKISPSIMCADFLQLEQYIKAFEICNVDMIHVDIMDGCFVPNYTLGTDFIKKLKSSTDIPLDIHLMIEQPESKLEWFEFGEKDYVSIHIEATAHVNKAINIIKSKGAKSVIAINPGTPICMAGDVLDDADAILLMTVNPGFAGQSLVTSTLNKIRKLRKYLDETGRGNTEIEVDGNVSFENAKLMKEAGANIFVAGTSSVFSNAGNIYDNISKLKNILQ